MEGPYKDLCVCVCVYQSLQDSAILRAQKLPQNQGNAAIFAGASC